MRLPKVTSMKNIGVGLLALLVAIPLIYAQRSQPSGRGETGSRSAPAPRSEPARAPAQRSPAVVDRTNHGTIRHVDTYIVQRSAVVQRPAEAQQRFDRNQHVLVHHDVDVDVNRRQNWHGFVFGARRHGLWAGYAQVYVNGFPYYYDDGIYYQQMGDDYQAVYPPVGANLTGLPDGAIEIDAGNITYYYAGGAFYVQQGSGYVIVATPTGVTVPGLPPGAVQVSVNNGVVYQFNGIYYQPVFVNGVTQYTTATS